MEYFESDVPRRSGFCSDAECPCNDTLLASGQGYLWITQDLCDFRRDCRTMDALGRKLQKLAQKSGQYVLMGPGIATPLLICELAANRRRIDTNIARQDAQHWWKTGQVPLRPTPLIGGRYDEFNGRGSGSMQIVPMGYSSAEHNRYDKSDDSSSATVAPISPPSTAYATPPRASETDPKTESDLWSNLACFTVILIFVAYFAFDCVRSSIIRHGHELAAAKKYHEAADAYNQAISLGSNDFSIHSDLAEAYKNESKFKEAVNEYKEAMKLEPNRLFSHMELGDYYLSCKKYDEAINEYVTEMKINPTSDYYEGSTKVSVQYACHLRLGDAYRATKSYDRALEEYHTAQALNPESNKFHYRYGDIYSEIGQIELAFNEFVKAEQIEPSNADIHANLGAIYLRQRNFEAAIREFNSAIELDPSSSGASYNGLGAVLSYQDRFEEAAVQYQKAIAIEPNVAVYHYNLGQAYRSLRMYKDAGDQFRDCFKLGSDDSDLLSLIRNMDERSRQ